MKSHYNEMNIILITTQMPEFVTGFEVATITASTQCCMSTLCRNLWDCGGWAHCTITMFSDKSNHVMIKHFRISLLISSVRMRHTKPVSHEIGSHQISLFYPQFISTTYRACVARKQKIVASNVLFCCCRYLYAIILYYHKITKKYSFISVI